MIDGKYVIALDSMGGDNAPAAIVAGAVAASRANQDVMLLLVGKDDAISSELKKHDYDKSRIRIISAASVVTDDDHPAAAIKSKKDSSMVVGLNLLKSKQAEAFVSAGNTGALLAGSTLIVGRTKGIERPAIATVIPTTERPFLLIDSGANVDCKPSYLAQFAMMGEIYMESVLGVEAPRVGLVNIGTEEEKGNAQAKEAHQLLRRSGLNFVGNIEAKELPYGAVDVAVCDGFVGNVVLKLFEGLSKAILGMIKNALSSSLTAKIGALLSMSALRGLKKRFDVSDVGGAPFLGLNSLVVKAHGSSDARAVTGAINQCVIFISSDIITKVEQNLLAGETASKQLQPEKEND
ncbi:MAG: phosphate acyltransferase PlsX [Defluviitaleaceae bacterium]|nr:phosphate acyltransferase PlsX [Defluviitaleaceae bacterium]